MIYISLLFGALDGMRTTEASGSTDMRLDLDKEMEIDKNLSAARETRVGEAVFKSIL